MLGSLQNQVAIVTGGSRGIGRGIARVLAKAGANVLVAGLEENECREAAEELRSFGVEAEGIAGDVTKRDFCEKWCALPWNAGAASTCSAPTQGFSRRLSSKR